MNSQAFLALLRFVLASGLIWQAAAAVVWMFSEVKKLFSL